MGVDGADWFLKLDGGILFGLGVVRMYQSGVCDLCAEV